MKRLVLVVVVAAALAVAPKAEAALITGQLDIAGNVQTVNAATGLSVSKELANAINFSNFPTPYAAYNFQVTAATGSFAAAGISGAPFGTLGTIMDFAFVSGAANASYPYPPITGFQFISSPSFSFNLASISILTQNAAALSLVGFGTMNLVGYTATPGIFYFSTQGSGTGTFSFSATTQVPEPGTVSMILLGSGLLGLAAVARRRIRKA